MEMYQVYRQTMGNKPLLFGGGSPDTGVSEDLPGVDFINGDVYKRQGLYHDGIEMCR